MVDRSGSFGLELIVGGKRDATFGPIVLVGAGGITAEVMNDRAIGIAPVTVDRALEMLKTLRLWPMLENFRNRGPLDVQALAEAVVGMSRLVADNPAILEVEANPIFVSFQSAVALDAACGSCRGQIG